jgi:SAM-dependent methyltransferase
MRHLRIAIAIVQNIRQNPVIKTVSCGVCGSAECTVLYPAGVAQVNQIVKCDRCDLMYASPRRDADDVVFLADDQEFDFAERHRQRYEKEQIQLNDTANTRRLLKSLHPDGGKIIEIGSSCGFQLDAFRSEGWEILGIDPDRNAARHAVEKLKVPTINTILESAEVPDCSADAVVMLHVIEHLPAPVGTHREIFRVLKPGGHLVLETPRYDTLMFKLLGRRERSLSCDGHIFFFTDETLRRACTLAGFEPVRLDHVGRTMTLDRLGYNVGVMSKTAWVKRAIDLVSRRLRLHKLSLTINARDMQRVVLTKPLASAAQV